MQRSWTVSTKTEIGQPEFDVGRLFLYQESVSVEGSEAGGSKINMMIPEKENH